MTAPIYHSLTSADLPVPFGRYVLESVLGEGGMAKVFRATLHGPAGFTKAVALKVIKGGLHEQMGELQHELFLREARLGGLLRHPNLVDVYELGEVENEWFLSMEWVDGLTLADAIAQRGAPPAPVLLSVARGLCAGLHSAHTLTVQGQRVGLVHRDIKPSNVLLGWNGAVKIADFGMAHVGFRMALDSDVHISGGSPGYMSPEQWAGQPVDTRSDLFSLGCVLYELALGEYLFEMGDAARLRRAVREVESQLAESGAVAALDARCAGLGEVVRRCMRVDPAERYAQVSEVDGVLQRLEAGVARHPSVSDWLQDFRTPVENSLLADVGIQHLETLNLETLEEASPPVVEAEHKDAPVVRTNLVEEPNVFVGRTAELSKLSTLFEAGQRLVTVLGPPGTGKTRLVKRFGAQWLDSGHINSAWFCDLTEARTSAGVLSAVAAALNVPLTGKTADETVLGQAIAGRGPVLLLIDNAEQVAEPVGQWLAQWWEQAPEACFVVTSRVPLRMAMEQQFSVSPLPLPGAGSDNEAVALFVARAQAVQPAFSLTDDNRVDVAAIVTELDGLPLAIELAAARVRMWAPKKLRARLSDRFRLLSRPSASVSRRQATLQGALDWSWELLQPWEQAALAQCSVFRGGFDWEAAETVLDLHDWPEAPWVVDVVAALVEHSLVMVEEGVDGERRLRLLVSVQVYGAGKLTELGWTDATEQRHARHYAAFGTEENIDALDGHGGAERRRQLKAEVENLVAATERGIAAGWAEAAGGACLALLAVLRLTGPFEQGAQLAGGVLALEGLGEDRGRFIHQIGLWNEAFGHMEEAAARYTQALAIHREVGNRRFEGNLLGNLGSVHMNQGRLEEAAAHYSQALTIHREVGNRRFEGIVLGYLGILHMQQGRIEEAAIHYNQSLAMAREVGYSRGEGIMLANLGALHKQQGRLEEAAAHYTQSLAILRKLGDRRFEGIVLANLGNLHMNDGRMEETVASFNQALAIYRKLGDRRFEGIVLSNLGFLHVQQGRMEEAAAHYTQSLAILREVGNRRREGAVLSNLGVVLAHQGDLVAARQHLAEGEDLLREVNDPIELGKHLCKLGQVERLAGNPSDAVAAAIKAESIATELGVNPSSELARDIAALRTALSASDA